MNRRFGRFSNGFDWREWSEGLKPAFQSNYDAATAEQRKEIAATLRDLITKYDAIYRTLVNIVAVLHIAMLGFVAKSHVADKASPWAEVGAPMRGFPGQTWQKPLIPRRIQWSDAGVAQW